MRVICVRVKFHPIVFITLLLFTFAATVAGGLILQLSLVVVFLSFSAFIKRRRAFWKKMLTFGIPLALVLVILNDFILTSIKPEYMEQGVHYALRFLTLLTCLLTIVHVTTPTQFALGLRSLKLPHRLNHIFLLSFEVFDSFRTIAQNVSTAQQLRGFRIRKNIFSRTKNLFPLFFPVVFSALSMSLDRGIAFDLKGIESPVSKTYLLEWKPTALDKFLSAFLLVLSFLVIVF